MPRINVFFNILKVNYLKTCLTHKKHSDFELLGMKVLNKDYSPNCKKQKKKKASRRIKGISCLIGVRASLALASRKLEPIVTRPNYHTLIRQFSLATR